MPGRGPRISIDEHRGWILVDRVLKRGEHNVAVAFISIDRTLINKSRDLQFLTLLV